MVHLWWRCFMILWKPSFLGRVSRTPTPLARWLERSFNFPASNDHAFSVDISVIFQDTPWKFIIAPKNSQSQKETHLLTIIFQEKETHLLRWISGVYFQLASSQPIEAVASLWGRGLEAEPGGSNGRRQNSAGGLPWGISQGGNWFTKSKEASELWKTQSNLGIFAKWSTLKIYALILFCYIQMFYELANIRCFMWLAVLPLVPRPHTFGPVIHWASRLPPSPTCGPSKARISESKFVIVLVALFWSPICFHPLLVGPVFVAP